MKNLLDAQITELYLDIKPNEQELNNLKQQYNLCYDNPLFLKAFKYAVDKYPDHDMLTLNSFAKSIVFFASNDDIQLNSALEQQLLKNIEFMLQDANIKKPSIYQTIKLLQYIEKFFFDKPTVPFIREYLSGQTGYGLPYLQHIYKYSSGDNIKVYFRAEEFINNFWENRTGDVILCRDPKGNTHTNIPLVVVYHSPTGIEWGYGGSGPSDLSLNILFVYLQNIYYALAYHNDFKWKFIANIHEEGGIISKEEIIKYLCKIDLINEDIEQKIDEILHPLEEVNEQ